ncbi:exopolysaccharide biosynthesis protein [Rhodobacteraceae bacterium LMO-12]|nr:exopolysaccharide biosynthesis protein [Rhodobacteraceae bacterium LMO-JJ12]
MNHEIRTLSDILDALDDAGQDGTVSLDNVLQETGDQSFAPLILIPSLILVSPLSGILGLPTIGATIIFLITLQKLTGRPHVWMPATLTRRSIKSKRLQKAVRWLRPVASWGDRHTDRRLRLLTSRPLNILTLIVILGICLLIPFLEVLPMVTSVFAVAISLLAVGLLARDGLFTLLGYLQIGLSFAALWYLLS